MIAQRREAYTLDAEFALEQESELRHEYIDGRVVVKEGESLRHNTIQINPLASLRPQLRPHGCRVLESAMRLSADGQRVFYYPDLSVMCGPPELLPHRPDTLLNPVLLVEILSPESERFDRGKKFHRYRHIPSLRDYLLIEQAAPSMEHFARGAGVR